MQVTPDDSHMAFVTASPVTQYDNAGHSEMYTYDPSTERLVCVSCVTSAATPTSDVRASENGLFMTEDGRTFFSTDDALVHTDTNQAIDVYEYVEGHPQLITLGTGETRQRTGRGSLQNPPGLVGVSANGTDVYFATYDTLVRQDHNGLFIKFYDARSGGGFSAPAPPPPCEAADECHGPGNAAPAALQDGTSASLAGGSATTPASHKKGHGRRKKQHKKGHRGGPRNARGAHRNQGGSR
jgi:hypothetical protein